MPDLCGICREVKHQGKCHESALREVRRLEAVVVTMRNQMDEANAEIERLRNHIAALTWTKRLL